MKSKLALRPWLFAQVKVYCKNLKYNNALQVFYCELEINLLDDQLYKINEARMMTKDPIQMFKNINGSHIN